MNGYKNFCVKICKKKALRTLFQTVGAVITFAWVILYGVLGYTWPFALLVIPALIMVLLLSGAIILKDLKSGIISVFFVILPTALFARVARHTDSNGETYSTIFAIVMIIYAILYLIDINTSKD